MIPFEDFYTPQDKVFYLHIHVVLVGPTVHAPLVDILLRFRLHCIGLITDVKMYRAVQLVETDKDLHRFVWRSNPDDLIKDQSHLWRLSLFLRC